MDEPVGLASASQGELRSARRLLRRKQRVEAGLFLAEGPQAVREALATRNCVQLLLVAAPLVARHAPLIAAADALGLRTRVAAETELASLADTSTPQGVVAICRIIDVSVAEALANRPRLVVCSAQVRDPGNAGTVIRCADAFGAGAVILTAESVDAYNPKTVRATVGSLFHLPLVLGADLAEVVHAAHATGLQVLAADGAGTVALHTFNATGGLDRPTLWIFGNEAWGLPPEHAALADHVIRVPIFGAAESLNLGAAAAVCLYASAVALRGYPR